MNNEEREIPGVPELALTGAFLSFLEGLCVSGRAGEFWRSRGIGRADIRLRLPGTMPPPLRDIRRGMGPLLASLSGARLRISGLPFCLLGEHLLRHEYMVTNPSSEGYFKAPFCSSCSFAGRCAGFPDEYRNEVLAGPDRSVPDKPIEVMVEAESACGFSCPYCFNRNTFAAGRKAGDGGLPELSSESIRDIVTQLKRWGVPRMRFTGGEPMLRPDLAGLMGFARDNGVRVWVNTNGHGLDDPGRAAELTALTDNVLVSLRGWDDASDSEESGVPGSFRQSCGAARELRRAGLGTLRLGVCATGKIVRNLGRVGEVLKGLAPDRVEFYRPVPFPGSGEQASPAELRELVDTLLRWRAEGGLNAYIANPLPFCFYDEDKVGGVSLGAVLGEGNARFAVDPRGFCKPAYYMDVDMGPCSDLPAAWNSPFSRAVRSLEYLPESCAGCFYAAKCRGGSRHAARLKYGSWSAPDPLSRAAHNVII